MIGAVNTSFDGAVVELIRGCKNVQYGFGRCRGARMIVVVVVGMVVSFGLVFFGGTLASCGVLAGGDGVGAVIRALRGVSMCLACAVKGM